MEKIEAQCFSFSGIEEFHAPSNLRSIESGAFTFCENLKTVSLNDSIRVLGSEGGAFDDHGFYDHDDGVFEVSGLEEIAIPGTLEKIGYGVFRDCDNLRIILVEEGYCTKVANYVRDMFVDVDVMPPIK